MDTLKKLRDHIDRLDEQIASLLDERMQTADQIGKIKRRTQQDVADGSREKIVLRQVETVIQHPILKANIANIYKEIMQESKTAQQFFKHFSQPFHRIGMIGVGLIGGSICKGIKIKDPSIEIGALFHSSGDHAIANEGGWVDHVYTTLPDLLRNSELVILASPISTIIPIADEIRMHAVPHEKLFVIDTASVKGEIVKSFEMLSRGNIEYISTHPMAGKEKSGFVNSQATLFVDRPWIVVPHSNNSSPALDSIKELILFLGAKPVRLEADAHDQQTALVSHLPAILSKSYLDFVLSTSPDSKMITGPGFDSFTRLAHDNFEMRTDIMKFNKVLIQYYLDLWLERIKQNWKPNL